MAKKMSAEERAKALINEDFQEDPNAPYQDDSDVVDAANSALHSAGNLQRQTHRQMFNKDQEANDAQIKAQDEQAMAEAKQARAKALANKKK